MDISVHQPVLTTNARLQPDLEVNRGADDSLHVYKVHDAKMIETENIAQRSVKKSESFLSNEARAILLQEQEVGQAYASEKTYRMNTSQGYVDLNLDDYFTTKHGQTTRLNLDDITLLMPSADNIAALSEHVSSQFNQVLKDYGISAPSRITYDQMGQMRLPHDYPHGDALKKALAENPGLERELRTLNALTSHYVEMQKSASFHEEYAQANTDAEIDAIIQKYSHLFWGNRENSRIALEFTQDGNVSLLANGTPVSIS